MLTELSSNIIISFIKNAKSNNRIHTKEPNSNEGGQDENICLKGMALSKQMPRDKVTTLQILDTERENLQLTALKSIANIIFMHKGKQ